MSGAGLLDVVELSVSRAAGHCAYGDARRVVRAQEHSEWAPCA